jgi:hypothetical protein
MTGALTNSLTTSGAAMRPRRNACCTQWTTRLELVVSEQRLDHPNVGAALEQMGCEASRSVCRESLLRSPAAVAACLKSRANWRVVSG